MKSLDDQYDEKCNEEMKAGKLCRVLLKVED